MSFYWWFWLIQGHFCSQMVTVLYNWSNQLCTSTVHTSVITFLKCCFLQLVGAIDAVLLYVTTFYSTVLFFVSWHKTSPFLYYIVFQFWSCMPQIWNPAVWDTDSLHTLSRENLYFQETWRKMFRVLEGPSTSLIHFVTLSKIFNISRF